MNICWERHDEIVHEGRTCPACELVSEKDSLEREVEDLQERLNKYEQ